MARILIDFFSSALGRACQTEVFMPQAAGKKPGNKHPVLYLLHGTFNDQTAWGRLTAIERHVNDKDIAVVVPAAQDSAFSNMIKGERFYDHVAHEIPNVLCDMLPLCNDGDNVYIAGLSMGGYGALKIGLLNPSQYTAIGAFSCNNQAITQGSGLKGPDLAIPTKRARLVFGRDQIGMAGGDPAFDLFEMAKRNLEHDQRLPSVFIACGDADRNVRATQMLANFFLEMPNNPYRASYHEAPGNHDWVFWDTWIKHFLDSLPLDNTKVFGRFSTDLERESK